MHWLTVRSFLLLVGIHHQLAGSAQFSLPHDLNPQEAYRASDVKAVDMDNDGLQDILYYAFSPAAVAWYRNEGELTFSDPIPLPVPPHHLGKIDVGDMDGDGAMDVVCAHSTEIAWWRNDGTGHFSTGGAIGNFVLTELSGDGCMTILDLDTDGDSDVVLAPSNQGARWFENDGSGTFTAHFIVTGSFNDMSVTDINGDGDMDLVCAAALEDQVLWFLGDGSGNFTAGGSMELDDPGRMVLVDVDNDGDPDLAAGILSRRVLALNDGTGMFQVTDTLSAGSYAIREMTSGDIDADGDPDLMYSGWHRSVRILRQEDGQWTEEEMGDTLAGLLNDIELSDLDQDGDPDMVVADGYYDKVTLHENTGAGTWATHQLAPRSLQRPFDLRVGDLNGDQRMDIVVAESDNGGSITIHQQDGYGTFPVTARIDTTREQHTVELADMDLDGDIDIIDAYGWSANDGSGQFVPAFAAALDEKLFARDLDLDGDTDLVSGPGLESDGIRVWLNDGVGGLVNSSTIPVSGPTRIGLFDIDGDWYVDLVRCTDEQSLAFRLNDGTGTFLSQQSLLSGDIVDIHFVHCDLDGDGREDLLMQATPDALFHFHNNGSGGFDPVDTLTTPPNMDLMGVADVNLDGHVDLLGRYYTNQWLRNDGMGGIGPASPISYGDATATAFVPADLDGDGDIDVIVFDETNPSDELDWYENLLSSPFRIEGSCFLDADGDGTQDPSEGTLPNVQVLTTPFSSTPFSNDQGAFTLYCDSGNYQVEAVLPNAIWTISTDSTTYHASLSTSTPVRDSVDFGVHALIDSANIVVSLLTDWPTCSAPAVQWAMATNRGTRVEHGVFRVAIDTLYTYNGAVPAPDSITAGGYYWHIEDLYPFDHFEVALDVNMPSVEYLNMPAPIDIEVITLDSTNAPTATYTGHWHYPAYCGQDPNDKLVEPPGFGPYHAIGLDTDYLTYTVRFQNTGTATTQNVVLRDAIHPDLDLSTFELMGTSHTLTHIEITQERELVLRFDNILLPDSGADQMGSRGFARFRLRPLEGLASETAIENSAGIYFDYNAAVLTNTTLSTLVDCSLFSATITSPTLGLLEASEGWHYQWFLAGDSLPDTDTSALLAATDGEYEVFITSVYGCMTSASHTVSGVGLAEPDQLRCAVFPNPSTQDVLLISGSPFTGEERFHVMDGQGRVVRVLAGSNTRQLRIEREGLRAGMYSVFITRPDHWPASVRFILE